MSILKKCPSKDAKSVSDPPIGYMLISVNSTPVIKRPVTQSQKSDSSVELAHLACQLWKLFGVACSLTFEFCSESCDKKDVILNFKR